MVYTENIEFEWDPLKAESNFKKHGVKFEEAIFVFYDPEVIWQDDEKHSVNEKREVAIGQVGENTYFLAFTQRNKKLRLISARKVNEKEKEKYRKDRLQRHS